MLLFVFNYLLNSDAVERFNFIFTKFVVFTFIIFYKILAELLKLLFSKNYFYSLTI